MADVFVNPPQQEVNIKVEVPEALLNLDGKIRKKIPGTMRRIAMEAKSFWKTLAGQRLKSSRNEYQKAISLEVIDDTTFSVKLSGFLPYAVEYGHGAFDMKPGFLKNAKPIVGKRKFPRAVAATLANKSASGATQYRVIPLNVNRYINMTAPTVFRTVTDKSPQASWQHPGWKGMKLSEEVVRQLESTIIPKHINKMFEDLSKP